MSDTDFEVGSLHALNDNSQTIVLVIYKDEDGETWQSDTRHFDRVPTVGEYVSLERDADLYLVKAVVHMAFPLDYDAEIYCVKVPYISLRQQF